MCTTLRNDIPTVVHAQRVPYKGESMNLATNHEPISKQTILIVDDNQANCISFEAVLRDTDSHREIITASSGEEALDIASKIDAISLILMDISMPGINGFKAAQMIRDIEQYNDVPILFMSAYRKTEVDLKLGYSLGGFDYISKPVQEDLLKCRVEVFLRLERQKMQLKELNQSLKAQLNERTTELAELRVSEELSKKGQEEQSKATNQYDGVIESSMRHWDSPQNIKSLAQSFSNLGAKSQDALNCYFESIDRSSKVSDPVTRARIAVGAREVLVGVLSELVDIYSEASKEMFQTAIDGIDCDEAVKVATGTSLGVALQTLRAKKSDCLLVMDGDAVIGTLTQAEFTEQIVGKGVCFQSVLVDDYMNKDFEILHARDPLAYALNYMSVNDSHHIPILDQNESIQSVLSVKNIIQFISERYPEEILNLPPKPDAYSTAREGA